MGKPFPDAAGASNRVNCLARLRHLPLVREGVFADILGWIEARLPARAAA